MAEFYVEVLCPICGRGMGTKAKRKKTVRGRKGIVLESKDYLDFMLENYDENKPFGVIKQTGSMGFKNWHYISIKDEPVRYMKFKKLVLLALRSMLKKKWLIKEDIKKLIE